MTYKELIEECKKRGFTIVDFIKLLILIYKNLLNIKFRRRSMITKVNDKVISI